MSEISVVLTMDVEPTTATSHPQATGPQDWAHGERAARGYFEIGAAREILVTYFIHPETAVAQAKLFIELERQGACLGLHLHPWKYSLWRHDGKKFLANYGELSSDDQRALLAETSDVWAQAIGHLPRYFRSGAFSSNDATFRVLAESGFRGGSCSVPGRVSPDVQAIWSGAEPDPHRANANFRQVRGDLEFAEVPLSVDFSALLTGKGGRKMHADLRPDTDWPLQHGIELQTIAANIVTQTKTRAPAVPAIVLITHNHYEYRDDKAPATQRLHAALDALSAACAAAELRPVGATLASVVDRVLAIPPLREPFVCEAGVLKV